MKRNMSDAIGVWWRHTETRRAWKISSEHWGFTKSIKVIIGFTAFGVYFYEFMDRIMNIPIK